MTFGKWKWSSFFSWIFSCQKIIQFVLYFFIWNHLIGWGHLSFTYMPCYIRFCIVWFQTLSWQKFLHVWYVTQGLVCMGERFVITDVNNTSFVLDCKGPTERNWQSARQELLNQAMAVSRTSVLPLHYKESTTQTLDQVKIKRRDIYDSYYNWFRTTCIDNRILKFWCLTLLANKTFIYSKKHKTSSKKHRFLCKTHAVSDDTNLIPNVPANIFNQFHQI